MHERNTRQAVVGVLVAMCRPLAVAGWLIVVTLQIVLFALHRPIPPLSGLMLTAILGFTAVALADWVRVEVITAQEREIATLWRRADRRFDAVTNLGAQNGYAIEEEWDLKAYDWHYMRACHAIKWGIAKYDEARAAAAVAEPRTPVVATVVIGGVL